VSDDRIRFVLIGMIFMIYIMFFASMVAWGFI